MKSLSQFLFERQKHWRPQVDRTKILVFDIDDTILRASDKDIRVYKLKDGKETSLSTEEFAKDPDKGSSEVTYDYREFQDPDKAYASIVNGIPLLKNLKFMDKYLNQGWCFCFLTARGLEDVVAKALRKILRFRNKDGQLLKFGKMFRTEDCAAVNDQARYYIGETDFEKKSHVLRRICQKYSKVIFMDDDENNLRAARELGLPNLQVIKSLE